MSLIVLLPSCCLNMLAGPDRIGLHFVSLARFILQTHPNKQRRVSKMKTSKCPSKNLVSTCQYCVIRCV